MKKMLLFLCVFLTGSAFSSNNAIVLTDNNSYAFTGPVTSESVTHAQLNILSKIALLKSNEPFYLVLDTPGGSVISGLQLIDTLKSLNRPIHTITIFAASMGYQIAQELGTRYIIPSGTLMSHRGAVNGMSGQIPGELNSRIAFLGGLLNEMNVRAAARIGVSVKSYQDSIVNELWSFGQNAVNTRQEVKVVTVVCAKELLSSTYEKEVSTFFGSANLVFSKCPLISAPIAVKMGSNVKPENVQVIKKILQTKRRKITLTF